MRQPRLKEIKTGLGKCKWNLPRSWREKKPFPRVMSSLIARMAPQPDLQTLERLYPSKTVRDWRDWRGILSSHSHGHKLCPPACCLTVSLWLQNSGLPFDFLRVFLLFVQICSGSTGFLLTCRTNFLGPSKKALALLINPNPILHIRLTRYRNTDYLFFLCYLVQVSKELKKFLIILLCWYI